MGGVANVYNGLGQRVSQTVSSITTEYLLDVQPGLWKVLAATKSGQTTHYVHGPRGIQAFEDHTGNWGFTVQDALGSVRGELDASLAVIGMRDLAPYGDPIEEQGVFGTPFGFTGEQVDANDLLYLRARQYSPGLGVFASLDPVEGQISLPLTLNRYGYTGGNPVNSSDRTGACWNNPNVPPWQRRICERAFRERYLVLSEEGYGIIDPYAAEQQAAWSVLPYEQFRETWNEPDQLDVSGFVAGGIAFAGAQSQAIPVIPDPGDVSAAITALSTLLVAACAVGLDALTRPVPFDFYRAEEEERAREEERVDPLPWPDDPPCPWDRCSDVEDLIRTRVFDSYEHALENIRGLYSNQIRALRQRPTNQFNDVCPEIGEHTTLGPRPNWPFSIICCPCCGPFGEEFRCYHTG